jgi:hypothetical protein
MKAQRWMWIAWPAFLMAAVLEMLVFAFVDPSALHWQGQGLNLSREAIYTLAFFVFWGATMLSSALTTLLALSPFEVNRCPVPVGERPRDCAKNGRCS